MEQTPRSQPDGLLKKIYEEIPDDFILYFMGQEMFDAIDWTIPPEPLEQEFNEMFVVQEPEAKAADKITRFYLKNGDTLWLINHVEFEGKGKNTFSERMFEYVGYIRMKYKTTDVAALAIFIGKDIPKDYGHFRKIVFGTEFYYKYNTYVVRNQEEETLIADTNPYSLVVLALLYMIKAREDKKKRLFYKKKLMDIAKIKNLSGTKFWLMSKFIQKLVTLPSSLEQNFQKYLLTLNSKNMYPQTNTFARVNLFNLFIIYKKMHEN